MWGERKLKEAFYPLPLPVRVKIWYKDIEIKHLDTPTCAHRAHKQAVFTIFVQRQSKSWS